ncbi:unnamed protein product [Protopolystoma xenopodis]|uniref:Uncharacterized protein n=1 Tax=Protopolystoma xenopodis TaxID=117903 RepID=A0A3S5BED0_9PLAT|nr:unnamed protein product [Protopolystoma xenopodis]
MAAARVLDTLPSCGPTCIGDSSDPVSGYSGLLDIGLSPVCLGSGNSGGNSNNNQIILPPGPGLTSLHASLPRPRRVHQAFKSHLESNNISDVLAPSSTSMGLFSPPRKRISQMAGNSSPSHVGAMTPATGQLRRLPLSPVEKSHAQHMGTNRKHVSAQATGIKAKQASLYSGTATPTNNTASLANSTGSSSTTMFTGLGPTIPPELNILHLPGTAF